MELEVFESSCNNKYQFIITRPGASMSLGQFDSLTELAKYIKEKLLPIVSSVELDFTPTYEITMSTGKFPVYNSALGDDEIFKLFKLLEQ